MTTVWSGRSGPILGVVLILALTACQGLPRLPFGAPTQPAQPALYTISTPFNEAEFAPYGSDGRSSISGEAYVRVPGGISLAAGSEVVLVPDTAYTRELWEPARSGRYNGVANFDQRYFHYRRSTFADQNGYFRFTKLPPGSYIVQTNIYVPEEGSSVFLHRRVKVEDNAAQNIILSVMNQE